MKTVEGRVESGHKRRNLAWCGTWRQALAAHRLSNVDATLGDFSQRSQAKPQTQPFSTLEAAAIAVAVVAIAAIREPYAFAGRDGTGQPCAIF